MNRHIIVTSDGSSTIEIPSINVTYHSRHGAIHESMHVFIESGLKYILNKSTDKPINIFEMGFGTGLNALLTAIEAKKAGIQIRYVTVEQFPLTIDELMLLNYGVHVQQQHLFLQFHETGWNLPVAVSPFFTMEKHQDSLENFLEMQASERLNISTPKPFHLIYYDAFAPAAQPELWTAEVFQQMRELLLPGGVLITYCAKGDVRRAMQSAGLIVTRLPGPPGKREVLRAEKN